jgi:hypothetical protein
MKGAVFFYAGLTTILLGGLAGARLLLSGGKELASAAEGLHSRQRSLPSVLIALLLYAAIGLCLLPVAAGIVIMGLSFLSVPLDLGQGFASLFDFDRLFFDYISAPLALCCFNTSLLLALWVRVRGWEADTPRPVALLGTACWILSFFFLWTTIGFWVLGHAPQAGQAGAWLPWLGGAVMTALSLGLKGLQNRFRPDAR